ncbi:hypothetical protein E6C60_3925 [Paenibacillus algicola]|uniref:phospholipase D n=1 Tax=Paenibacillus algicola TaxID=2565926 RepID=A0A4P8XRR1_9BACL|nr:MULTISPECIES: phospholipase D family protein [Paenibacillus]QCT04630.1 hypothetical protein E6C60_3925 [Paenibacillus algicola]
MILFSLFNNLPEASAGAQPAHTRRRSPRFWVKTAVLLLFAWLLAVLVYHTQKPLPDGISYESPLYQSTEVAFWHDLTYPGPDGQAVHEQQIYDRMHEIIDESRQFLVIDMFLFNDYTHKDQSFPQVSREMTDHLISHKSKHPEMDMFLITDEVNTNYGSSKNPLLEDLKQAGITVIITNVEPLRDSTPIYSAFWRTFIQWFGQAGEGQVPNLMAEEAPDMTVRSYMKLLNVKANHRKVIVSERTALVSSANVHAASAYHSNIAFEAGGEVIRDVLAAEQAAASLSGPYTLPVYTPSEETQPAPGLSADIRYLTEGKVYKYVLKAIEEAEAGDTLWMGMFYLAEGEVMDELVAASQRGVQVRLILDPNQNAFGRDKIGIPNRPAAAELKERSGNSIDIRWYNTGEEQYHTKLLFISKPSKPSIMIGGSTNFTPRNLKDYNLENNFWLSAEKEHEVTKQVNDYFNRLWNNVDAEYTLELSAYEEDTVWLKSVAFRIQKLLGFTTF